MEHALSMLPAEDRCIPWFLPLVDPECRLCTPFEARNFSRAIENVGKHICNVRNKAARRKSLAIFWLLYYTADFRPTLNCESAVQ